VIRGLRPGRINVYVEGVVVEKGDIKRVRGGHLLCRARLRDDEGREIDLNLWDEQIGEVEVGDRVRVENGYVTSWRGRLQLNTGRRGRLIVLDRQKIG